MAATLNHFDLLLGAGEQVSAGKKKGNKKKSNKAKAQDGAQAAAHPAETVHTAPAAAKSDTVSGAFDLTEACAIVEKAARCMKMGQERLKLWKDWIRQANDKSSKPLKYSDGSTQDFDFKQMLLRSRALEITIESCLSSPLSPQNESNLQQLVSATLPNGERHGPPIAAAVVRLGDLLTAEATDTLSAAQRAISTVIGNLKLGSKSDAWKEESDPVEAWVNKLAATDRDIVKQNNWLQKLTQTSGNHVTKEQLSCSRETVQLQQHKFDLLQPHNLPALEPASTAGDASVQSVLALKDVIENHLKEAEALAHPAKVAANNAVAQRAQTVAALKREEQLLSQQAADLAAQIKSAEAHLASLRAHAAEVEQKRLAQQKAIEQRAHGDAIGHSPQGVLPVSHYAEELDAVEILLDVVDPLRHSVGSPEQVYEVQANNIDAPADYIYTVQNYLSMNLGALSELPSKIVFCKQRIEGAAKLKALGTATATKAVAKGSSKEDAEKLLNDYVQSSNDMLRSSMEAVQQLHARFDYLSRVNPDQSASLVPPMRMVDDLASQIRVQFEAVLAQLHSSTALPAAPAPHAAPAPAVAPPVAVATAPTAMPLPVAPRPAPAPVVEPTEAPKAAEAPNSNGSAAALPPGRQWAKVQNTLAPDAPPDGQPTPAEAFKPIENTDGFQQVGKKNRRRA